MTRALRGKTDPALQVAVLADTARWSTDSGPWQLSEAIGLIAGDSQGGSEALSGLLAAIEDLGLA